MTKLEQASTLDRVGDRLQRTVLTTLRPRKLRDVLHGLWLGHPLHPSMVHLPIGAWLSSTLLDLVPAGEDPRGQRRASTVLVAIGVAGALPTAVVGLNDWAALSRDQRRVGLVHALANTIGLGLFAGSLAARLTGRHGVGRTLGLLGITVSGGGAYLGGHLAYKQGAQVSQSVSELHRMAEGWQPIADMSALPERTLLTREVDDVSVILYRQGDEVTVMLERCPHQSGPLGQGEVTEIGGHACVVCPWHGSAFQLDDGEVRRGPAGTDQQVLPTRVVDGVLQTRLP